MIVVREQATAFTTEAGFSCIQVAVDIVLVNYYSAGASGGHRGYGSASGHHGYAQTNCRLPSHDGGRILGPCHDLVGSGGGGR